VSEYWDKKCVQYNKTASGLLGEAVHRLDQGVLYVQYLTQFHFKTSQKYGLP